MTAMLRYARNERGIALITVLLVAMVVAVISVSAAMISSTANLINAYGDRQSKLEAAADAGIETVRSALNGDKTLYPASGYATFESEATVYDAAGAAIPGLKRWLYAGPTGITSGQYGVFGSVVAVVEDATGNKVVRRGEIVQESFAKYAYFTNIEGSIVFANQDQIWGPVHSNDQIKINNSTPVPQVIFHGPVVTASNITNKNKGQFDQGYTEYGPNIPLPTTADLDKLRTQATAGGVAFVNNNNGNAGQSEMRIEFVAVDVNNDGFKNGTDEGFIRVYTSANEAWVVASRPTTGTGLQNSPNCGHMGVAGKWHAGNFATAAAHTGSSSSGNDPNTTVGSGYWQSALTSSTRKCFLGGADSLWAGQQFTANDGTGSWMPRPGGMATAPNLSGLPPAVQRPDTLYLFPITRAANPAFKGVIFVDGKVAISGQLRGRITLAATGNIVIADDVKYVTDPGAGTCTDILGLFSGADVILADNTLNAPSQAVGSSTYYTFDDTKDEYIHGVVLALDNFTVENYNSGASNHEDCGTANNGRGCLYLSGGIIQRQRGAVGLVGGEGYIKRYSYDTCGLTNPPPYFPTTGRFARGHYYEVDPTGFDIVAFYNLLTPGS
jgi:hypothetical protein